MEYWVIALVLLILGLGLAVLEVFFPSGGMLAFLCVAAIVGAVWAGFRESTAMGVGTLVLAGVGLPTIIVAGFKVLPNTRMGRKILLDAPTAEDVLPDDQRQRSLKELVGRIGVARSTMLPAGVVKIDGRTIDAISEGMPVEPGQKVRVMEVRGNRVVVRLAEGGDAAPAVAPDDPLSRPIESIGSDPFDEEDPLKAEGDRPSA